MPIPLLLRHCFFGGEIPVALTRKVFQFSPASVNVTLCDIVGVYVAPVYIGTLEDADDVMCADTWGWSLGNTRGTFGRLDGGTWVLEVDLAGAQGAQVLER